jgi:hypothetical protein
MSTVQLAKSEWQTYFDQASKEFEMKLAEIEVSSLSLGNQIESRWAPLHGVSYDSKNDVLAVFVEGMEHMISRPQTIFVEKDNTQFKSMEVLAEEDTRHIIRIKNG